MLLARIASRAQLALHAPLVHVEVHLGSGLPTFQIVGLPATAVRESKDRVRAALVNSGFEFPAGRIIVNLAPADIPKEGGRFDLPIALGVLIASEQLKPPTETPQAVLDPYEIYGELALSGELKPVKGLLLAAAHAVQADHELIVPAANVEEVCIAADGRRVHGAIHLLDVCKHLQGTDPLPKTQRRLQSVPVRPAHELDLRDVRGQLQAKRALMIAAAGAHSLLMVGPPGSGKSMLAQRLPGLLPPLDDAESLEVAMIASASTVGFDSRSYGCRPFRSPHHTVSTHALVGGGPRARPGEVSLAHRGVLFLDEFPEFERRALEALREPMESGVVAVSRVAMRAEYPAEFQLIVAMNPCPCGYFADASERCDCPPTRIAQYRSRLSGPLLDRMDLRIVVPTLTRYELMHDLPTGDSTADAAARVLAVRRRQIARAGKLNSRISVRELREFCQPDAAAEKLFWQSQSHLGMSARSYHHLLRVARTIADLDMSDVIRTAHVAEALQLRRALDTQAIAES